MESVAFDLRVLSNMFSGQEFARTVVGELELAVRIAFVVIEGRREDKKVSRRGGKMISLVPERDPRGVTAREEKVSRFLEVYERWGWTARRRAPVAGFVGLRLVDDGIRHGT